MTSLSRVQPTAKEQPRVDIIILDWNRPDSTILAIRSALAQTGVDRTIWVVDQGSEPAHRARLARFCEDHPEVKTHWLGRNVGVAAGRNIASALGDAPYIVSLDNDAVFGDNECVARAITRFEAQPELGAVAFRVLDADTGSEHAYWDYPQALLHAEIPSFEVTRFLGGGHAMRREAFECAGRYDERLFFGGEERDVAWRMLNKGYKLRLFRDLAVLHMSVTDSKLQWNDRRYFFLVRNSLYINHKYGAGPRGFARGALSFTLRGARNGLCSAAMRGIAAGLVMSIQFSLNPQEHAPYRLSPELRRYIDETDQKTQESYFHKLRRQLTPLPKL
ncbi:MAG: glycosyltransferase [Polyangiales bacterium]